MNDTGTRFASSGLCPSCFHEKGGVSTCPACGYNAAASESDWNRLRPGTVLCERYVVGKALGQGGFGVTYLGLDTRLHTKLAVKEYYPSGVAARNSASRSVMHASDDMAEDFKRGMEKFLEEARTLARFEEHPNIVSVKDFFEENGTAYMVMNYVEGKTLAEHLKERGGKIPFDEAMTILTPLMDALDEIHASGTIHRDLSPDNIFITRGGQPKLLDFGASKSAFALMQQRSHSVILKHGYSPPEQYRNKGRLGPWTDVYGMAATLYRCVTGEAPPDAMDRIADDPLVPPRRTGTEMSERAEAGLLRALSFSSKNRQQSMREFHESLAGEHPFAASPAPESPRTSQFHETASDSSSAYRSEDVHPPQQPITPKEGKKFSPKFLIAALLIPLLAFFIFGDGGRTVSPGRSTGSTTGSITSSSPSDLLLMMAQEGDAEAQIAMGFRYYEGGDAPKDYAKAVEWWSRAAEQGNAEGQFLLGMMYVIGEGVRKSDEKAVELWSKAAAQGHSYAQNFLGDMYHAGRGVVQNYKTAVVWFRKAAEQGNVESQYSLGWMYEQGQGLSKDEEKAADWYAKAAAQGHDESKKRLDLLLAVAASRVQPLSTPTPSPAPAPALPPPPTSQEFIRLARHGSAVEVKKAIEAGAPLETSDERYGGTPLMWAAAQNKDLGAISALLSAGANVNARDTNDGTALLWAAGANREQEVLSLLIAAGADANARDKSGDTMKILLERHSLVAEAQRFLNELGYDAGAVDGKAGPRTAAAVKAFQSDAGLSQDGIISTELVVQLQKAKEQGLRATLASSPVLSASSLPRSITARDGTVLLLVPAGEFEMGDGKDGDNPKHRVHLDAYYIGKYAVTNAQYAKFVRATGHRPPNNKLWDDSKFANHPVVNVSWNDAMAYAKWAGCTLPTEAQWEKAARGPQGYVYPWGNSWDPSKLRHSVGVRAIGTAPVDAYPGGASGYGTYQQAGNVLEWCSDWYHGDYYTTPDAARNPRGPSTGSRRVLRGGSWGGAVLSVFRGADRYRIDPSDRDDRLGFRLARTP